MKRLLTILCVLLLATSLSAQNSNRIAVFEFKAGANIKQEDVTGISQMFITHFQPDGYTLVDRTALDKILSEQRLQHSEITDSQKIELGKIYNISKIVNGTVNLANGEYNVDVAVIDVTRGSVVAKDGKTFPKSSAYRNSIEKLATSLAKKIPANDNSVRERTEVEVVLDYLKVYPTELGIYSYEPTTVIKQINLQHRYDYDTWRIPTTEELDLLRNNGYVSEATYITSSKSKDSGILLLVTDATETYSEKQARLAQEAETRNAQKRHAKTEPTFVNDTYPEDKTSEPEETNTLRSIIKGYDKKFTIMGDLDFATDGDYLSLGLSIMAGNTLNDRVFLGLGTGVLSGEYDVCDLPLYFNTRVYITKNTFIRPYISTSIGLELMDADHAYFNASLGLEAPYSKKTYAYLSLGYECLERDHYNWREHRYQGGPRISLKLGLRF